MKKLLSLILAALFVAAAVPAYAFGPDTAFRRVTVESADALINALSDEGPKDIVLIGDINYHYTHQFSRLCVVAGDKKLDLNGHAVTMHYDESSYDGGSILFCVDKGATLVLNDSSAEKSGFIRYNAPIDKRGTWKYRNIFEVNGTLIVNGGCIEAGRSKSFTGYNTEGRLDTVWKQTFGTAICVCSGGRAIINGGTFIGRGDREQAGGNYFGVIDARLGSSVSINGGEFLGKGGAACIKAANSSEASPEIRIAAGRFSTSSLEYVYINGNVRKSNPCDTGVTRDMIAFGAVTDPAEGDLSGLDRVTVTPGTMGITVAPKSGKAVAMNDGSVVWRMGLSDPTVGYAGTFTPYFITDYPEESGYGLKLHWSLFSGDRQISAKWKSDGTTVNLITDFDGFVPVPGETYSLRCELNESVCGGVPFTRTANEMKFVFVQSDEIPEIFGTPERVVFFSAGGTVNLDVSASGADLNYTWQKAELPIEEEWKTIEGENSWRLKLTNLGAPDDNIFYRCVVSNYAGTVYTECTRLIMRKGEVTKVELLDFGVPEAGNPLDFSIVSHTAECEVTAVRWTEAGGETLYEGYRPYAGQNLTVEVDVRIADGMAFSSGVIATLGGKTGRYPSNADDVTKSFRFTFKAGAGGTRYYVDVVELSVGTPKPGIPLGEAEKVDAGYGDLYSTDVRYSFVDRAWFENGERLPSGTVAEEGHDYTLRVVVSPYDGWQLGMASMELNGERMEKELDGENAVGTFTFKSVDDSPVLNPFVDVAESDWFYEPVMWAVTHDPQVTNGTDATHFSPNSTCTRAQIVTFLWRTAGEPEPASAYNPFVDVPAGQYYYKAVLWAVENGVTNGVDATHFGPDRGCTRGQVVTFLYRFAGSPAPGVGANPFVDLKPDYYYDAVLWAVGKGITNGTDATHFSPNSTCTRGQIVTFLYRMVTGQ